MGGGARFTYTAVEESRRTWGEGEDPAKGRLPAAGPPDPVTSGSQRDPGGLPVCRGEVSCSLSFRLIYPHALCRLDAVQSIP